MKKHLHFIVALVFMASVANAQIDKSKFCVFLPFDGSIEDQSESGVEFAESTNENADGAITYEAGKFGQAAAFDKKPIVSSGLIFDSSQDFTVAAWIYMVEFPTVLGFGQTWVHQIDGEESSPGRIHLEVMKVKENCIGTFTGGIRCDNVIMDGEEEVAVSIELNTWYHVANVQDATAGTRTLYIDGVPVNTVDVNDEKNTEEIVVGGPKNEGGNPMIRGGSMIDDLLITQQALSLSDLELIIANGVNGDDTFVDDKITPEPSAFAYYADGKLMVSGGEFSKIEVYSISGAKVYESISGAEAYNISMNPGVYIAKVYGNSVHNVKFSVR